MNLATYHVLHLSSIIVLVGYTFYAFAAPAETRKRVVMITGVAALLTAISGFAMLGKLHLGFPGWIAVKVVCLIGLACMVSFAYRRRAQADAFMLVTLVLAITAVAMVFVRPF